MPRLALTLTLEAEGRPTGDSPIHFTAVAPLARTFSYLIVAGGGFALLPTFSGLSQVTALVFTATAELTLFVNGQDGTGIPLHAGSIVAFLGLADTIGLPLWQIVNAADTDARIRGVVLGLP